MGWSDSEVIKIVWEVCGVVMVFESFCRFTIVFESFTQLLIKVLVYNLCLAICLQVIYSK